jgi:hypothetical protein
LFENFRENSLKQDLSNDTTVNPPHFSLVNTFKPMDPDPDPDPANFVLYLQDALKVHLLIFL